VLDGNAHGAIALDRPILDHGVADAALTGLLAARKTLPPKLYPVHVRIRKS